MKTGIVVVNKSDGMTSHDVVEYVRRKFNMRMVGHAGTLDPLATGVLIILLGKATKLFNKFVELDKAYNATLLLGSVTDTADIEGSVIKRLSYTHVTAEKIEEAFKHFSGRIEQVPPMVSAIKINGRRLYQLARKGIEVPRQSRSVHIHSLKLVLFSSPEVKFYLECSKGTYVRQLAQDVGEFLGCGACIFQIQRTKVGPFLIDEAVTLDELNENHIRQWEI